MEGKKIEHSYLFLAVDMFKNVPICKTKIETF
jgi:hypothetical protein